MLEALDAALLRLAERVVKQWNWATGKDNFSLARFVATVSTVGACGLSALFLGRNLCDPAQTSLVVFLACWLRQSVSMFINAAEAFRTQEQLDGARRLDIHQISARLRMMRLTLTIVFVPQLWWMEHTLFHHPTLTATLSVIAGGAITVDYLVSVEKPPFARSKLWERAKGFLASLAPTPPPAPAPVPA